MVDSKKSKKIVLMGLDAAGKSSILLSLQNDTRLSSFKSLPPTIDVSRSTIEDDQNDFFIFDYSGQEVKRSGYLRNLDKHLGGVDKIIFVIDIKDDKRHEIALDYLEKIVKYLVAAQDAASTEGVDARSKASLPPRNIQLSIFFHKYDLLPGGKEDKSLEPLARDLAKKISLVVPSGMTYEIQLTSLYVRFQKTRLK